ncbi:MAG: DUF2207 family protein [Patescibacteria group bacterium]
MKRILFPLIFIISIFFVSIEVKANYSEDVTISTYYEESKKYIDYTIKHVFEPSSQKRHGIFLSLPKLQDGISYNYKLEYSPTKNDKEEKYRIVNEIDQFRVKIGDENTVLEPGEYVYKIRLSTNAQYNNQHEFVYLKDWNDYVNNLSFIDKQNAESICSNIKSCNSFKVSQIINSNKPKSSYVFDFLNVYQTYLWGLVASISLWFGGIKKILHDPFKSKINKTLPHYTVPDNLTPWQAQSLISKGNLNPHNTINSYVFYLYNKGFINLQNDSNNEVKIIKIKELPNDLAPVEFNTIVESYISNGIKYGLTKTKIPEYLLDSKIESFTLIKNDHFYKRRPVKYPLAYTFFIMFFVLVAGLIFKNNLQEKFYIGNSIFVFLGFMLIPFTFVLYKAFCIYHQYTQDGVDALQQSYGYKYYLDFIEKEKLNFDNNPEKGLKFYLDSLPYAAQFGLLEKFNEFFKRQKFFDPQLANNTLACYIVLNDSSFYSNPIENNYGGSGGGSGGGFSGGGGSW